MALSRRFKNLIVDSPPCGAKWLRCVDLKQLFNDTAPSTIGDPSKSPPVQDLPSQTPVSDSCNQAEATAKSEEIQISHPIFKLEQHNNRYDIHCFPLPGGRVAISDNSGRTLFYDANSGNMMTMPTLHKPKRNPISLFVPSADADDHPIGAGSLYIMERVPEPEKIGSMKLSDQFEALVCRKPSRTYGNPWHCQPLLPPPFVREPAFGHPKNIISYGVVGSNIFISTMCNDSCLLDTVSNTWTRVGKVVLPYYGKIEYVPELNLWFGLSAEEGHLAAADISTMDSQPQLVGEWKDFDPPAGWQEYDYPQLVSLGSGKFCTARFFQTSSIGGGIDRIAVFTGVEVMQVMHDGHCNGSKNGEVKLIMEKHKTRFHVSNGTTVTAIF